MVLGSSTAQQIAERNFILAQLGLARRHSLTMALHEPILRRQKGSSALPQSLPSTQAYEAMKRRLSSLYIDPIPLPSKPSSANVVPQTESEESLLTLFCETFSSDSSDVVSNDADDGEPPRKRTKTSGPRQVASAAPSDTSEPGNNKFRPYQAEKWQEKYEELVEFRNQNKNCLVPHTFPTNPPLARWVKRQRYQYKLLQEGKQSSMTKDRIKILEKIGFVWDSHEAAWQERLKELVSYRAEKGNCLVPSNYPANPQLATWVKCQRRQYKLYWEGRQSNMTLERINELEKQGFEWELRSTQKKQTSSFNSSSSSTLDSSLSEVTVEPLEEEHGEFNMYLDLLSDLSEDECDLSSSELSLK